MIEYSLESIDGTRAVYTYKIKGRDNDTGTAVLDMQNDSCEVTKPAPCEVAIGYPRYGGKMRHALETFKKKGAYLESGTVAWY